MMYGFEDYCVCPGCRGRLQSTESSLQCLTCGTCYEIKDGIPILLPHYTEAERNRYLCCYQDLAQDDLAVPLEGKREARHSVLINFVGDVRGKRVLDIGSSNGIYLRQLDAGFKVAFDLAHPFLAAIPKSEGIIPICGDAETLPFQPGFFDVIIVSDILEHLLKPERLIDHLRAICTKRTKLIVHIPWREDISPYGESKYEFTHLRSFGPYTFAQLWTNRFRVTRTRPTYPSLEEPIFFHLEGCLPTALYSLLVQLYYGSGYVRQYETQRRTVWMQELPKRERWLLCLYPSKFKIFELRPNQGSFLASLVDRLLFDTRAIKLKQQPVQNETPPS
jgi:uncharacterized protein YbaR (Trm112 family)